MQDQDINPFRASNVSEENQEKTTLVDKLKTGLANAVFYGGIAAGAVIGAKQITGDVDDSVNSLLGEREIPVLTSSSDDFSEANFPKATNRKDW